MKRGQARILSFMHLHVAAACNLARQTLVNHDKRERWWRMNWLANGVRLLGLAVMAVWEYWLFRQRYSARNGKLRAKQMEGTAAVLKDVAAVYVAASELCTSHQHTANEAHSDLFRRLISAHTQLVTSHRTWLAFLPADVNTTLAHFLHGVQSIIATTNDQAPRQQFSELHAAYIDIVAAVRSGLGEAPLQQETLDLLELTDDANTHRLV